MDLGENLQNAFDHAKEMTTDVGRWIILVILSVIPIVNFIVLGYASRVIKETPSSKTPPKLEGYPNLWVQGLKIVGAALIYMIIPIIIFGLGVAAFWGAGMAFWMGMIRPGAFGWVAWPMAGLGGLLIISGIVVAFLIAIIATMGIVHMIKKDAFGKAFAFNEITEIIGRVGWGKYILWLIVVFVISLIFGAIGNIPWIGWLIALILIPPFVAFMSRSAGLIYEEGIPPRAEAIPPETGEVKYCIQCGTMIPKEAEFCPKCGAKQ